MEHTKRNMYLFKYASRYTVRCPCKCKCHFASDKISQTDKNIPSMPCVRRARSIIFGHNIDTIPYLHIMAMGGRDGEREREIESVAL